MSTGETLFAGLVMAAFGIFAATLAYQSFAEGRWLKSRKG
jgi:hypothetical protein